MAGFEQKLVINTAYHSEWLSDQGCVMVLTQQEKTLRDSTMEAWK